MNNENLKKEWLRYLELKVQRPELFVDNGSIRIVFDEDIVAEYEQETGRKIGVVYESPYTMKLVDLVYETPGSYFAYERSIPTVRERAVVTVPVFNDKFILLKQYRHCIRDYEYSFPRGFGERGLAAEENAKKELHEEIGAEVTSAYFLGEMTPDSGGQSTVVSVYCCEVSSYDSKKREEGIESILEVGLDELNQLISEGKVRDGFTLSALCLYFLFPCKQGKSLARLVVGL